jgi:hypothetical protein
MMDGYGWWVRGGEETERYKPPHEMRDSKILRTSNPVYCPHSERALRGCHKEPPGATSSTILEENTPYFPSFQSEGLGTGALRYNEASRPVPFVDV